MPGLEYARCHIQCHHEPVRGHIYLLQVRAEKLGKSSQLAGGETQIHTVGDEPAWMRNWTLIRPSKEKNRNKNITLKGPLLAVARFSRCEWTDTKYRMPGPGRML